MIRRVPSIQAQFSSRICEGLNYKANQRGGIVNLIEPFKFSFNESYSQENPGLFQRAYQATWFHNTVQSSYNR
jgi:hypothetical protein